VYDDRRTLTLRRDFSDHGLGGEAINARAQMPSAYVEIVRASLCVLD
jgi:hypothetical protein